MSDSIVEFGLRGQVMLAVPLSNEMIGSDSFNKAPDVTVAGALGFVLVPKIRRPVSLCILSEWEIYSRAVLSLRQLNNSCKKMEMNCNLITIKQMKLKMFNQ